MRRLRLTAMTVVVAVALTATWMVAPGASAQNPNAAGSFIVVLHDSVTDPGAVAGEHRRSEGAQVSFVYRSALKGYAARMSPQAAARIAGDRRVAYVEADGAVTTTEVQPDATWGLDRIDQRALPLDGSYSYTTAASDVWVYVIDTGIRASHAEFGGRVVAGATAISDRHGTNDCNGHGTHVAGTIGGTTYGVAKQVKLVPVRVLNCQGSGTWSGVIAGIDWVTNQKTTNAGRPMVANMSLGGGYLQSVNDAVSASTTAGVTYVVAAGNEGADACGRSPASTPSAITVGATTSTDARTSWSNWGTCVDLFAPGAAITSAWHTSNTATSTISGTSMAAPHVAGVAALHLAGSNASPSQVTTAIIESATENLVTGPGAGSPNLLLHSTFADAGGGPGDGDGGAGEDPPPGGEDPPAEGVTLTGSSTGEKNTWTARVTVSGLTPNDAASGTWSNGATGTGSCTADTGGTCTISVSGIAKKTSSVTFTLTSPAPTQTVAISKP